ncbi:tail-specific protease [Planktosalinus lacus]|uniref:Tail-specific protease n=2 Tax=Planktosalinus lacus TaxID=1526573 RepID=A0A8J2V9X3_9FLAO|nr:tail-specific protease [Planktosalinus lacus]
MRFMKKNFKVLLLVVFVAAASCSFTTKSFDNPEKDKLLVELISYVLEKTHFANKELDDTFSSSVYNKFINDVDPLKRYFLASDIEEFKVYEHQIDDQLKNKDLTFFNVVHERLEQRMMEAKDIYKKVLDSPFDFTEDQTIDVDYEKIPYANTPEELEARWKEQLKFSTISTFYDIKEEQNALKDLKPGEAEDERFEEEPTEKNITEATEPKTDSEIEIEARESTLSSLDDYFSFIDDLNRKDYFAIFVNSIVEDFDPHTNYLAPQDKDRFDVAMSGKLEGIGARLQKQRESVKVVEVISGGPAWRGEEIEVGDLITRVRQEGETESVSIGGMRLDDAVGLIKGPKGTKVTLTIKKMDGTFKDVTIVRDVVELEETYAKSTIIDKDGKKYGLIDLPRFYFDMTDYKARNAASDVKEEVIRLKEEGMEGLVLDLRNNGGGSLKTAIDIAGLFIEKGPIVQVASGDGEVEVLNDRNSDVEWDGPLVILVNEISASASEILAAAMQDYERGVVIGSKQTYGKGTVQNVIDLNRWMRNNQHGDLGALKVTTQKFYRINGGSTQLEGVKSDVVVPDRYSYFDLGERDYKNPMPYDKIAPADYQTWDGYINLERTIRESKNRIAASEQLKLIDQQARWIKERRDNNVVPLNYEKYIADIEQNREKSKEFDSITEYENNLGFSSHIKEQELKKLDSILSEKRSRWHKNLSHDIYVEEAVNVLEDLKMNNIKREKLANIKD